MQLVNRRFLGALSLADHLLYAADDGYRQQQRQHIRHTLNRCDTVSTEDPGQRIQDGDKAAALPGGGQSHGALGVAQAHAVHVDDGDPGVDGQSDGLGDDGEGADAAHFQILARKEDDELVREDDANRRHDQAAPEGHPAGEAVALLDPVVTLGTPVETGHGLEAVAEAQDDAEGEHHDLGAHADARQNGIGDAARQGVQQDARDDREAILRM